MNEFNYFPSSLLAIEEDLLIWLKEKLLVPSKCTLPHRYCWPAIRRIPMFARVNGHWQLITAVTVRAVSMS